MSYILKQYDNHLAYFDIYYDIEGFRVEKFKIVEDNKNNKIEQGEGEGRLTTY